MVFTALHISVGNGYQRNPPKRVKLCIQRQAIFNPAKFGLKSRLQIFPKIKESQKYIKCCIQRQAIFNPAKFGLKSRLQIFPNIKESQKYIKCYTSDSIPS
jgi:hypothetical protein